MIILDNPRAVTTTEHKYLGCPRCRGPVEREGFGFVSCAECNSIMLWEAALELRMAVT